MMRITRGFQSEDFAVLLAQSVIIDIVGSTEDNGTKEGKKGRVFKIRVNNSADNRSINQLNTQWDLSQFFFTMNNFLKRSH
jgi:hypothetical protein